MAKKHPPGFAPVPFKLLGKVLFPLSLVIIIFGGLGYLAGWAEISPLLLFIGIVFLLLSLYLLFVVPKE